MLQKMGLKGIRPEVGNTIGHFSNPGLAEGSHKHGEGSRFKEDLGYKIIRVL